MSVSKDVKVMFSGTSLEPRIKYFGKESGTAWDKNSNQKNVLKI